MSWDFFNAIIIIELAVIATALICINNTLNQK